MAPELQSGRATELPGQLLLTAARSSGHRTRLARHWAKTGMAGLVRGLQTHGLSPLHAHRRQDESIHPLWPWG